MTPNKETKFLKTSWNNFFSFVLFSTKNACCFLFCPTQPKWQKLSKKKESKTKQLCNVACFFFVTFESPKSFCWKKKKLDYSFESRFFLVNEGTKTSSFCLNQFFCGFFFTKRVDATFLTKPSLLHQKTESFKKLFWLLMSLKEEWNRLETFAGSFFCFCSLFFC